MFVYETAIVQAVISTGEVGEVPGKVEGARAEMPREQLLQPMHHCTCIRAGDHGWGEGDVAAPVHAAENIVQRYLKPALLVIWVKWLLVTSLASEFVLAPKKSKAAAWSIWCAHSWVSRQKWAAGLQGHPSWLQNS